MTPDDILGYVVVVTIVIIPVLAITARIALRPIIEAVAQLRELAASPPGSGTSQALQGQLDELRATTAELRDEVRTLREAGDFYRALQAPQPAQELASRSTEGRGSSA